MSENIILKYRLIPTKRRLTFEILQQDQSNFCGRSDDDYDIYKASNGIEIISRSRMDIQTDRLWLLGCGPDERSGSMVFSSDEKRDKMMIEFNQALLEWARKFYDEDCWCNKDSSRDLYVISKKGLIKYFG